MFKFKGKPNQGLSIRIGEMGIPEVDYWRRDVNDEYQSIPINLENTNQRDVDSQVQRHMDSTKTTQSHLKEDNRLAKEQIEQQDDEIPFEKLHSEEEGTIRELGSFELALREAAKECKVSYEAFLKEYNSAKGTNQQERIEQAKEAIYEEYERGIRVR